MILWLLRLIGHPILKQLSDAENWEAILQDRLERSDQEKSRLWEQNRVLMENLETYHRMDKNLEWQARGAVAPFPDAPHLPPSMVREPDNSPQRGERSQGSQLVTAQKQRFREQTIIKLGLDKTQ